MSATPHSSKRVAAGPPPSHMGRAAAAFCVLLLTGCGGRASLAQREAVSDPAGAGAPSVLDPNGPMAVQISNLWWVLLALGSLIFLAVLGYLLWALLRRRRRNERPLDPAREQRLIIWAGGILPGVVILGVFGFSVMTMRAISSLRDEEVITLDVTGHQWWWEVSYRDLDVITANEIHIPVGQTIEIHLTSADVIHSLWVPQLHGKLDANPQRVNTFHLAVDEPGVYWGQCTEYCGIQHAKMRFVVVAQTPADFEAWLAEQRQPIALPTEPMAERGLEVFLSAGCITCHRVAGTNATGELGPDLTHVASRLTLGAGAVENNLGNLGGWVADPHSTKPGVLMPPSDVSGEDLQALLAFLATLQ